jgi:hypothetical protein
MKNDDINITIDVISSQPDETPEEEFQFVSKEFTETAILYSMTGHIFISSTATDEYYNRALSEIKTDEVYKHVMSSVPKNMQYVLWDVYDIYSRDVDPILYKYLCEKLPMLATEVDAISKLTVREAVKYLEKSCLKNTTYALKPITFEDLTRFAEEASKEEEEKENSVNKI